MKGLTQTGRQVSEDPDLDNLLSTLSPEEILELDKDLKNVPDINLEDGKVPIQGDGQAAQPHPSRGKLGQREQSFEVSKKQMFYVRSDLKRESRKQEYLRKMGLSQEENGDTRAGVRRQSGVSNDNNNRKGPDGFKEELDQSRRKESSVKEDAKERGKQEDSRLRSRESTGGKTKDMISRLQERREEKDRRDDLRKRDDTKTKDIISKLREKSEKDVGRERRSESIRTQGLVSKMVEKQSKAPEREEIKPQEKTPKVEENDTEVRRKDDGKAEEKEKLGKCVTKNSPKTKPEEEEDEDSSMFDELMQQVQSNDPSLLEVNVNNSEVIKAKTLIEFTEALNDNTNVKVFALANCRADDHVAYAIAGMLRRNKTLTSINLDSNHLTGKGILSLIQSLQHNATLTELRFQNQRHICGGKTEMEMVKILKENTTLLKLGYHFELQGPRMTMTNILSRNMDRQRQRRLQEQKQVQGNGEKKGALEVPKIGGGGSLRSSPKSSPKPSPLPSPMPSPKLTPRKGAGGPAPPPPPPPPGGGPPPPPPPPMMDGGHSGRSSRDQLLASIRGSNMKHLKKVPVPKWLQ
uniref:Leiomodin-1 n=1 Tax=Oryzias melastigma TaxID=30732 RepID=A0A3B3CFH8_ORYME